MKKYTFLFLLLWFASFLFPLSKVKAQDESIDISELPVDQLTQEQGHERFHYPVIDGEETKAIPYLTLPFRKADLSKYPLSNQELYHIAEGWIYSKEELSITHVNPLHGGIDFDVPYGTPVVAPADGYALSSYNTAVIKDEEGNARIYKGKPISLGFGYFVRMYIPSVNRLVTMGHLSNIAPNINFVLPTNEAGTWKSNSLSKMSSTEWMSNPFATYIKKGTVVGYVGYSGLTWGYDDYKEGAIRPVVIDQNKYVSWDEPHLHFEEEGINPDTGEIGWQRDPYAVYGTSDKYPSPKNKLQTGKDPLFILNKEGLPVFADD
jgi:hypothetical protein